MALAALGTTQLNTSRYADPAIASAGSTRWDTPENSALRGTIGLHCRFEVERQDRFSATIKNDRPVQPVLQPRVARRDIGPARRVQAPGSAKRQRVGAQPRTEDPGPTSRQLDVVRASHDARGTQCNPLAVGRRIE